MIRACPSLTILLLMGLLWLEWRLLAGRATVGMRRFVLVFAFGCVGAGVLALLLERLGALLWQPAVLSYTWAPAVEEIAKAVPVLLIALRVRDSRRLTVADFALIGIASGLGFEFVESNLRALANPRLAADVVQVSPLLPGWRETAGGGAAAAGHAVWSGLVGLGAGIGLRIGKGRSAALGLAGLALGWSSFDHGLFNWELYRQSLPAVGRPGLPIPVALLQALTLHGRLELLVLPLALLAAMVLEARRCEHALAARPELLLPGESRRPRVWGEWWVALRRAPVGYRPLLQALTYFRHRRGYSVARAEALAHPDDTVLQDHVVFLEARLRRDREQVLSAHLASGGWGSAFGRLLPRLRPWALHHRWPLLFGSALALLFMMPPGLSAGWLRRPLQSAVLGLALAVTGLGYALYRLGLFSRRPPPDRVRSDGDALAGHSLQALLLAVSVLSGGLAVVGWLFPRQVFGIAALAFLGGSWGTWGAGGGNPSGLLGTGAGLGAEPERTWLAIRMVDDRGQGVGRLPYRLSSAAGSRTGVLGDDGYAVEADLEQGDWSVSFPGLDGSDWEPSAGAPAPAVP